MPFPNSEQFPHTILDLHSYQYWIHQFIYCATKRGGWILGSVFSTVSVFHSLADPPLRFPMDILTCWLRRDHMAQNRTREFRLHCTENRSDLQFLLFCGGTTDYQGDRSAWHQWLTIALLTLEGFELERFSQVHLAHQCFWGKGWNDVGGDCHWPALTGNESSQSESSM